MDHKWTLELVSPSKLPWRNYPVEWALAARSLRHVRSAVFQCLLPFVYHLPADTRKWNSHPGETSSEEMGRTGNLPGIQAKHCSTYSLYLVIRFLKSLTSTDSRSQNYLVWQIKTLVWGDCRVSNLLRTNLKSEFAGEGNFSSSSAQGTNFCVQTILWKTVLWL